MAAKPLTEFDVTILGGGMAGLCLARQLMLTQPGIRLLLLEKRAFPVPEAAFKVGESTVEVAATYLRETLQLGNHLDGAQLPKYGLRFFFNDHTGAENPRLDDGLELGLSRRFPNSSYQIDRGRLENYLKELIAANGATVLTETHFEEVELGEDGAAHCVRFRNHDRRDVVTTRWVVDATGRKGSLKRKLGLGEEIPHRINAVWFRLDQPVKIDTWSDWHTMGDSGSANHSRWLSTIHLMGEGYWVWIIPLASGTTSIGIVADPRFHALNDYNSYEKALAWLETNQPALARQIAQLETTPMDFLALKHFSFGCKQCFSADRWALVGEAGLFLDPFYSPGSDYIAMSNSYTTALIARDLQGKSFQAMAEAFDKSYRMTFANTLRIYQDQYHLFGNAGVMTTKIIWDYSVYWAYPALTAIQGRLTDLGTYDQLMNQAAELGELNARMQAFFRQWHKVWAPKPKKVYLDQYLLETMYRFNKGLDSSLEGDAFIEQIKENLHILRRLAKEIVLYASGACAELETFAPAIDEPPTNYMTQVWEALNAPALVAS